MKMEYDDCTTYSERIAVTNLDMIEKLHVMFKYLDLAQEYPEELGKDQAIQIRRHLDDMESLLNEGIELFIDI